MSRGIDYGLGTTNIDTKTGIRFGVINQNEVLQSWADSSEADYGDPHCPHCGNECVATDEDHGPETPDRETYECDEFSCGDYACDDCRRLFDDVFGDEPLGFTLDDGEYKATAGSDGDIFVLQSPYFTRAQFCSPCAPGACYLTNPCADGERAYCFGPDWFDDESPCPYPIYRVDTGKLIFTPRSAE